MGRALGRAEFFAQGRERGRILVIAVDVAQEGAQLRKGLRVKAPVLFDTVAGPRLELVQRPTGLRHPDYRHLQVTAAGHRLQ